MATLLRNSVVPNIGISPTTVISTTTNNRYTIIGLNLANTTTSMVQVNIQMVDSDTYASHTISNVEITGIAGNFTCDATKLQVGQSVTISGTAGGTGSITGYSNPTTYYIISTDGVSAFQLSATNGGPAITTTAGIPTGLTYTVGTIEVVAYMLKNIMVAPQSSLKAMTNGEKIVMGPSNSLRIFANANSAIDAVVSFVEIL